MNSIRTLAAAALIIATPLSAFAAAGADPSADPKQPLPRASKVLTAEAKNRSTAKSDKVAWVCSYPVCNAWGYCWPVYYTC